MTKIKKYQKGGCLSTTGSGTRTSIYKSAAGEGGSSKADGKAARQFARDDRKIDKAKAKMDREEAKAAAKAPKAMSGKSIKKYQGGGKMDPRVAEFLKKRGAADTTKMYNRQEMLDRISDIATGKIKPRVDKPMAVGEGTKKYATVSGKDTTYMSKADFEKKYANKKDGGKLLKKAKSGGSFPDLNKDGKVTKADILKGRGVIKNGAALKKQAAKAIAMKKAGKAPKKAMSGKMMMAGGKCKNGC